MYRKHATSALCLQSSEGNIHQRLAKSGPYAGPSAGTEVARLVPSGICETSISICETSLCISIKLCIALFSLVHRL